MGTCALTQNILFYEPILEQNRHLFGEIVAYLIHRWDSFGLNLEQLQARPII